MQKDYTVVQHAARQELGISFIEYVVADEIYQLSYKTGWCYKSKENMAARFGIDRRSVTRAVETLIQLGLIERDDETRHLRVSEKWYSTVIYSDRDKMSHTGTEMQTDRDKMSHDDRDKMSHKSNNIENTNKSITNVMGETPTYGNPEINEAFELWEQVVGYKIEGRRQPNRNAANNLIKKYGIEGVKKLLQGVALANSDTYAPRISDFVSLQAKYNDLMAWGNKKKTGVGGVAVI